MNLFNCQAHVQIRQHSGLQIFINLLLTFCILFFDKILVNTNLYTVLFSEITLVVMKINDKTLCSYWASNTPSDRQGWLYKRGEVNKAFQKRWCILKGNLLFYGDKPTDKYGQNFFVLVVKILLHILCFKENQSE